MNLIQNLNGEQPWPRLDEASLHGLPGDFVRTVAPHSEADPAALLVEFLAAAGNLVGPGPYIMADGAPHRCNLFIVVVGDTAKARKGTAQAHALRVVRAADPQWADRVVHGGLGSGEGLIALFSRADDDEADQPDRRAHVAEAEFARVLQVAQRQGCTLSAVLRVAWDSGDLEVVTRRDPLRVRGAHVSVVGHITRAELERVFLEVDLMNGLANRFLWVCAKRSKLLPRGGKVPQAELDRIAARLREVQEWAREPRELDFDAEALREWEWLYGELAEETGQPVLGAVLARAEAHVLRVALLYAVLDQSPVIRAEHLRAADAVWRYVEESARLIFGGRAGDPLAERVLEVLARSPDGVPRAEVRKALGGHTSAPELDRARDLLVRQGRLICRKHETNGRPVEVWRAASVRQAAEWTVAVYLPPEAQDAKAAVANWFAFRAAKGKQPCDLPREIVALWHAFQRDAEWLRAAIQLAVANGWVTLRPDMVPRPARPARPLTDEEVEEYNRRWRLEDQQAAE